MLDVGLDSAYNLYGEHKFITEDAVLEFMKEQSIYSADQHRKVTDAKDLRLHHRKANCLLTGYRRV
jgi:hypothetical protein